MGFLVGLLGISAFVVSVALSGPGAVQGQGAGGGGAAKEVIVANTAAQPVPAAVQGTVTVSGSVSVSNAPNPALQPWQFAASLDMADGEMSRMVMLPALPAGKRLVLEFGSTELTVLKTQLPSVQIVGTLEGVGSSSHVLAVSNIGSHSEGQYRWQGSHALRMYLDNGYVRVTRSGSSSSVFFGGVALSGHLVDVR
jgi:hypothetical protein